MVNFKNLGKLIKDEYLKARLEITFLISGISFFILSAFGFTIYYFFKEDILLTSLNEVKDIILDISKNIEQTQGIDVLIYSPFILPEGTYLCIYDSRDRVVLKKNIENCNIKKHFTSLKIVDNSKIVYGTRTVTSSDEYKIYVGKDIESDYSELSKLRHIIVYAVLGALGFIFIISFLLSKKIVAPLKEAMDKQERFIQNISHDLRTPLTVISNHIILLKYKAPKEVYEHINQIQKTLKYIKNIISDLTLMAQLKSQQFEKTEVSINDVIKDQLDILATKLEEKEIFVELDERAELKVFANYRHIEMLVANLLSNAVKYNKKEGEIYIVIDKDYFSIKNTGTPIKNPEKIFERFYREDEARSISKGSGIGLSIVKEIADIYGFKIKVNVKGGYNEFIVYIGSKAKIN
ncbi:MAG: hypothetical protein DSY66_06120 [Persephonella sp.]|nr:MAG: hypothetical protein DSY66_06120 [Persephonella sp.]RUM59990.1 MAG: hypothetical protein DSY53_01540 [Persephonella sp.]